MTAQSLPTYFISHGGGPWPYMEGEFRRRFEHLEAALRAMPGELGSRPDAVLMISGHWEESEFAVMASAEPPMVYDYTGFPAHTYRIRYPAPGSPRLAEQVRELIARAGLEVKLDRERGFDHGAFATLAPMYPAADVPVVQVSLRRDLDAEAHLKLGQALAPLRRQGVLIIGSGLSYHNLSEFGPEAKPSSRRFDAWLQQTLCHETPQVRAQRLIHWQEAPAARQAHPREDHLIPLLVAVGAAYEEPGSCIYHEEDFFGGIAVSNFRFG